MVSCKQRQLHGPIKYPYQEYLYIYFYAGICGDALIVAPDVTVEFICTGPVIASLPTWFVNGRVAVTKGNCYRLTIRRAAGINATATLTINGNHNCDTFNIYCRIYRDSRFLYLHNTTLRIQG